jgi:hypothetical protein
MNIRRAYSAEYGEYISKPSTINEKRYENMQEQSATNTGNRDYDLVSVLYHALEGAQTYNCYVKDAEQEGDQELAQFFRESQREEIRRADKAKMLLGSRMGQGTRQQMP